MQYSIEGHLAQFARLSFSRNEACWGSKGSIMSLDPGVNWVLRVPGGAGGATRRLLSGESIALTYITATADDEEVILSANEPGKIIDWDLEDSAVITTRGAFLAAFGSKIDIDAIVARHAGAAFFGGAGLLLQKVSGVGKVLVHGSGDFVERHLRAGQQVSVSTGNLAAFSESIDYNIVAVGGCRRTLFGGEGFFMTRLTGPGRVLLQSLKRRFGSRKQLSR